MTAQWGMFEEPSYQESLAKLIGDVERADAALNGVTWMIACAGHDDDYCPPLADGQLRLARAKAPGNPSLIIRVWFYLDDTHAHLVWVDTVAASSEEDDT